MAFYLIPVAELLEKEKHGADLDNGGCRQTAKNSGRRKRRAFKHAERWL
jgi:hypothetical protein